MSEVAVRFLPDDVEVWVPAGSTLLEAAVLCGVLISAPCGGMGRCGRCRVCVEEGAPDPTEDERRLLGAGDLASGHRLACKAKVDRDCRVRVHVDRAGIVVQAGGDMPPVGLAPAVRRCMVDVAPPSLSDLRPAAERVRGALPPECSVSEWDLAALRELPGALSDGGRVAVTTVGMRGVSASVGTTGDADGPLCAAACDLGTTTCVVSISDVLTGELLSVASGANGQAAWGDDVVSRIAAADGSKAARDRLREAALSTVNALLGRAADEAKVGRDDIYEMVMVGNTAMHHLFLGIPAGGLSRAPYVRAVGSALEVAAAEVGVKIHPAGRVVWLPTIGAFVGADTVAVGIACGMGAPGGLRLAVDIGTNGELLLGDGHTLLACSCAAGPALEGGHLSCGMVASAGAVQHVRLTEDGPQLEIIGDGPAGRKAKGLCGSAVIDLVAEMLRLGILDETGRMVAPPDLPEALRAALVEADDGRRFALTADGSVYLSQRDVREVQLALAAMSAGVRILLAELGAGPEDIETVYLAGAFGSFVDVDSALRCGLIPGVSREKVRSVGNAAGAGARMASLSVPVRESCHALAEHVRYVELAGRSDFQSVFAESMIFRPAV